MNLEKRNKLYQKAIDKWGQESQISMICEECLELALEIKRIKRKKTTFGKIEGEIADVEIMIEQAKLIFNSENIDRIKSQKLERLAKLIENS